MGRDLGYVQGRRWDCVCLVPIYHNYDLAALEGSMIGQCHLKKSSLERSIVGNSAGRRDQKLLPVYRYFVLVHEGDNGWCLTPKDSQSRVGLFVSYFWRKDAGGIENKKLKCKGEGR